MDEQDQIFLDPNEADGRDDLDQLIDLDTLEVPEDLLVEVDALRASLEERNEQLLERERQLAEGDTRERTLLGRYREALAASEPDLTVDDLGGDTIEELDAIFAAAREFAARVRAKAATTEPAFSVPAGAPGRRETSPVSSFDKIRAGLASRD